ncbi:sulfatase-like hydrolase/transferase [Mesorhizobium sp. M1076]|uniref:sulfatase-like hydrolase/transferase n=1 Tax=Mesorhizobium sp. M1076 TaxID=2957054 RepID=UPI003335AFFA
MQPRPASPHRALTGVPLSTESWGPFCAKKQGPDSTVIDNHCASAAGKTELPVGGYHIPMFFYGPGLVKPGHISTLVSQIDLPPTILRALGANGESHFFGRAKGGSKPDNECAFISNYQSLGYMMNGTLFVLRPKGVVESYPWIRPPSLHVPPQWTHSCVTRRLPTIRRRRATSKQAHSAPLGRRADEIHELEMIE